MQGKTVLALAFVGALASFGAAAQATIAVVSVAPPPPRHEILPPARAGWVWAPGHYEWRGNTYAWVQGHWMRDRAGYEYREPRWVQRGDGSWVMVGGNWEHRWEARRHARGRDWDGDGVPDRHDRFPRNPNRS